MATYSNDTTTLDLELRDTWDDGFVADVSFSSSEALAGWTFTFDYPGEIVNIWNAQIISQDGDRYVVEAVDYNGDVPAGGTVSFGFQGSGSVHEITPVAFLDDALGTSDGSDTFPVVSISDAMASEADGTIGFQVLLSEPSDTDVTVTYQTLSGTADAGDDFTEVSQQIVIPAGQTSVMIYVPLVDDANAEPAESFSLDILSVDGAETGDVTATGTITDDDNVDDGGDGGGPFVGGGTTFAVGEVQVITDFDPTRDVLDLGADSIHNQIPVDTADGFMMLHMFDASKSLLVEGVWLADLHPENFAPILDAHLQQDLSAVLAYEDGSGFVRPDTVYVRSHEQGLVETVDFNPATDKISFFYLSVRGDGQLNFVAEQTDDGARFYNPLTGQSLTLRDVSFEDLSSEHFEWRANQLEDNVAGRMGLDALIDGFEYVGDNIFTGKSVAMAGGVDRAPYHSGQGYEDYTGTAIDGGDDGGDPGDSDGNPVGVTVTGGSVTEADPGEMHVHDDGTSHTHDDGHRFITFTVTLDTPASAPVTLSYATADRTAIADTTSDVAWDYHTATGELTFAVGEQTKTISVAVHPDLLVEDTETFTLSVSGDNVTGKLKAIGSIVDNDATADDPDGSEALDAAFVVRNDWGAGATVQLEITNTDTFRFTDGWTVEIDLDPELISRSWNSSWTENADGTGIIVSDTGRNGNIGAGETVSVAFQLNEGGVDETLLNQEAEFLFL